MLPLISVLGAGFLRLVAVGLGMKIVLATLIMVVLPLVLKKFFFSWITEVIQFALGTIDASSNLQAVIIEITGVGAYLAQHLRLQDCLAVTISAILTRFTLSFVVKG